MALEMWFQEDMRNILLAVNAASASTVAAQQSDTPEMAAYRRGYQEALVAVALACGIQPHAIGVRALRAP